MIDFQIGQIIYYAEILPSVDEFSTIELKIRTVTEKYIVGIESKTKHAYLFFKEDYQKIFFTNRKQCTELVKCLRKGENKTW